MDIRRLLGLIVVALLIFFVFTRPAAAGNMVTNGLGLLRTGADRVVTFITTVV